MLRVGGWGVVAVGGVGWVGGGLLLVGGWVAVGVVGGGVGVGRKWGEDKVWGERV